MNRFIIVLITLSIGNALMAQDAQKSMNEIKSNVNYVYATGTSMVSSDEASQNAKDLLNAEIEEWLKQSNEKDIAGYIAKSQEQLSMIKTQRGSLYRVFVYVHKADVLPYYKEEKVISGAFGTDEAPIDTTLTATSSESKTESPVEAQEIAPLPEEPRYTPTGKEQEMLKITSFNLLNEYINAGRESGDIQQLGKYSTLPTQGLVYVFIHNRNGEIPACMRMQDGVIINLSTGKEDKITNYKGCGAIWVMFK
jgi:hypothetical protein